MSQTSLNITVSQEAFPLREVFTISRGSRTEAKVLKVCVESGGFRGFGECVPYARYDETLGSVEDIIRAVPPDVTRESLQDVLPAGAARNALDCALWDLEAKRAGKRVWDMLGHTEPVPLTTAFTLSLNEPGKMHMQASKNAFRPILKIKLGTPDDVARVEAVRKGAPDSQIIVDANEGWTADIYNEIAPHLKSLGVTLVEQPFPQGDDEILTEMNRVIPICADESCHDRQSLESLRGKYDLVNIKLDKTGGLTEALALKEAALEEGFGIMVGCMVGTSLAMAPAVLVAQNAAFTDLDGPLLLLEDRDPPLAYDNAGVHPSKIELWG